MKKHEAETLIATIRGFVDDAPGLPGPSRPLAPTKDGVTSAAGRSNGSGASLDEEALYRRFKARFIDEARTDPILLKLMAAQPEIVIEIEPREVVLDGSTLRGRVARLLAAGWFGAARKQGTCRGELARTGTDPNSGQLSTVFNDFVRDGFLTREGDGYQLAPGVKVSEHVLKST